MLVVTFDLLLTWHGNVLINFDFDVYIINTV